MAVKIEDSSTATKNAIKEVCGFDNDGNLVAQIIPRYDTLANLLAVADAGDGEIAHASDTDALVVYKGSPTSVGRAYHRGDIVSEIQGSLAFQSIANGGFGTWSVHSMTIGTGYDPDSLLVGSTIQVPPIQVAGDICIAEVSITESIVGHTVGTNIYAEAQRQRVSDDSWIGFSANLEHQCNQNSSASYGNFVQSLIIDPAAHDHIRVRVAQDDSAAKFMTGFFSVKFRQVTP